LKVADASNARRKEVDAVQYDLGLQGLGILLALSLVFGLLAQVAGRAESRWLWLIAGIGYFVGGLFTSEVMFATATEEELQPIIDGLMFDEALFGGLVVGIPTAIAARYITGSAPFHRHRAAPTA
jgi:hypothetical protein